MDKRWYQAIAGSRFDGKRWVFDQQSALQIKSQSLITKLELSISQIRYTAFEAIEIFNYYCVNSSAHITLIVNQDPEDFSLKGLMLLRFSSRIKLYRDDPYLVMELNKNQSFQAQTLASVKFIPKEDEFGEILWQNPKGLILNNEQLVKCAIKELVRSK